MAEIIEFPFDSGAYEAADREWLPPNLLERVENMRLDLDGRLGVRPGNSALGTSTYSANAMVAYDLASHHGNLIALGDQTGLGRATDLFEFLNGAAVWRSTGGADVNSISGPRMPRATAARYMGGIPDLDSDARYTCTATVGGFVVAVIQLNTSARVHVFNPVTDQTLVLITTPLIQCRACFAGGNLWVVGQNAGNAIIGLRINPTTEEALTQVTLVAAPGGVLVDLGVAQTGASDFTLAYNVTASANIVANRFNSAGTSQATWTHATSASTVTALGVCGNAGGTRITVMWHNFTAGIYQLQTRTQVGGAVIGPTTILSGITETVIPRVGICQTGTQICCIGGRTVTTGGVQTDDIQADVCTNEDTHAFAGVQVYADAILTSAPVGIVSGGRTDFYYGAIDRLADLANVGTNQLVQQNPRLPQVFLEHELAGQQFATNNRCGSCCLSGTKLYWGVVRKSIAPRQPGEATFGISGIVVETELAGTARRQTMQMSGELCVSGGIPLTYVGRYLFDQGFAEKPVCSVVQASGGGKTFPGRYFIRSCWEVVDSAGQILRSDPSAPVQIDLTDSAILASSSTPHSLRRHPLLQADSGVSIRVGFYSTIAGGGNFQLEQYVTVPTVGTNFGDPISVTLSAGDSQLATSPVLYTQSQTPVPHTSPGPYQYCWAAREREIVGGMSLPELWMFSKLLFPTEQVEFPPPGRLGFSSRANQHITAVGAFESVGLVWTKSEVSIIPGRGPEHNGTGEFDTSIRVPSPGGCIDWRSVVDAPPGFFFQMAADKLMLVPRSAQSAGGAGAVLWIGQPVRQTLALFPVITGAVHVRSQMIVAFSCTNVAGDAGRILIYDLRREQWYVDTVGPAIAISELDGRLAYISSNAVFLQDVAPGTGAFPTCLVQTGVQPVGKRLGWGHLYKVGLLGLDSGPCSVECLIDYDDGAGYRTLGTETFTGTGLTVQRFWSLAIQKAARFSLRFVMTGSSGTVGLRFNAWALEVEGSKNMVRVGSTANVA